MKLVIQGVLALVAVVLAWLIYDTIDSKIEFQEIAESRKAVVVERLKDIRTVQVSYKSVNGKYANNFDSLINFYLSDSLIMVKAIGNVPDSLTEVQAVQMGIVIRDTIKIAVKDKLFTENYPIDSIQFVPFSNNEKFQIDAGSVEKNKSSIHVFEAFADFGQIYNGLDLKNENIKLHEGLRVGSMTDATTTGNWE